jgi:hypothetical protein
LTRLAALDLLDDEVERVSRRRVLKRAARLGAGAAVLVPAILTVTAPSALANTSTCDPSNAGELCQIIFGDATCTISLSGSPCVSNTCTCVYDTACLPEGSQGVWVRTGTCG